MEVLRFVTNMIPSDSTQFPLAADISALPFTHQWKGFELLADDALSFSEGGTVASFYLFSRPRR